jgi:hypothetical protein
LDVCSSGLPDGIFLYQKCHFWGNFVSRGIEKLCISWIFGIFMPHWYNLLPFGILCGHVGIFFQYWFVVP